MKMLANEITLFLILALSLPSCAHTLKKGSTQRGRASWYGPNHDGHKTASGEVFDLQQMTGAHRTLPMNSKVKVTSLSSGKSVVVRINDRGPFSKGRIIDVSQAAAQQLGMIKKGTDKVEIEVLEIPK
ncbi:MAG: septal ring lytic transglycosylase RlpA family protein [Bacillota bacterium]